MGLAQLQEISKALGKEGNSSQQWVTVRFSPLTARRMLKQSLEKMRLLSVSLGPLMCRTLDHLLCPAGTTVVRCSVRLRAGLHPGGSVWEAGGTRGSANPAPGPSARKYGIAVLPRLTAAQAAMGSDPGPRSPKGMKEQQAKVSLSRPPPKQTGSEPVVAFTCHW